MPHINKAASGITIGLTFFPFFYFQLSCVLLCACMSMGVLVFFYEGNMSSIKKIQ